MNSRKIIIIKLTAVVTCFCFTLTNVTSFAMELPAKGKLFNLSAGFLGNKSDAFLSALGNQFAVAKGRLTLKTSVPLSIAAVSKPRRSEVRHEETPESQKTKMWNSLTSDLRKILNREFIALYSLYTILMGMSAHVILGTALFYSASIGIGVSLITFLIGFFGGRYIRDYPSDPYVAKLLGFISKIYKYFIPSTLGVIVLSAISLVLNFVQPSFESEFYTGFKGGVQGITIFSSIVFLGWKALDIYGSRFIYWLEARRFYHNLHLTPDFLRIHLPTTQKIKISSKENGMEELAVKDPALYSLLTNKKNLAALIVLLSNIRGKYYHYRKRFYIRNNAPLKYALKNRIYFPIAPDLYVTPVSDSFRRHIIFRKDKRGRIVYAIEIKIRGDKKTYPNKKGYDIAQEIHSAYGDDTIVRPIGFIETPAFSPVQQPMNIQVFAYQDSNGETFDARRVDYLTDGDLRQIAARYYERYHGDSFQVADEIFRRFVMFVAKLHHLHILGQAVAGDTDLHLGNFRLILGKDDFKFVNVGDTETFTKFDFSHIDAPIFIERDLTIIQKNFQALFNLSVSPQYTKSLYEKALASLAVRSEARNNQNDDLESYRNSPRFMSIVRNVKELVPTINLYLAHKLDSQGAGELLNKLHHYGDELDNFMELFESRPMTHPREYKDVGRFNWALINFASDGVLQIENYLEYWQSQEALKTLAGLNYDEILGARSEVRNEEIDSSSLKEVLSKKAKKRYDWIFILKEFVARVPKDVKVTPKNVAKVSQGKLTAKDIQNALWFHSISYEDVGMKRENQRKRNKEQWIDYLRDLVSKIPADKPKTARNVAAVTSEGLSTQDILNAMKAKGIEFFTVGMVREQKIPRSRKGWIQYLKSLISKLPEGMEHTAVNVAKYSNGAITNQDIYHALIHHHINYQDVNMVRENTESRTKEEWILLLKSLVMKLDKDVEATPKNVAKVSGGSLTAEQIYGALYGHNISYQDVDMVRTNPFDYSREEWIKLIQEIVKTLPKDIKPTISNVANASNGRFISSQIRSALHNHKMQRQDSGLVRDKAVSKTREEWIAFLKGLVSKLPKNQEATPQNVAEVSRGEISPSMVYAVLSYRGITAAEVGIIRKQEDGRSRTQWINDIKKQVSLLPNDVSPTISNVANYSGHFTPQQIYYAMYSHSINHSDVGTIPVVPIRRSKTEWINTIKKLIRKLPSEEKPTVKSLTEIGPFTQKQIYGVLSNHSINYSEISLKRERAIHRDRNVWKGLLLEFVNRLPQDVVPTPQNVADYSDGLLTDSQIRGALRSHRIPYAEVNMTTAVRTYADFLTLSQRGAQSEWTNFGDKNVLIIGKKTKTPLEEVADREVTNQIYEAILSLPEANREIAIKILSVFESKDIQNVSIEGLALSLGVSVDEILKTYQLLRQTDIVQELAGPETESSSRSEARVEKMGRRAWLVQTSVVFASAGIFGLVRTLRAEETENKELPVFIHFGFHISKENFENAKPFFKEVIHNAAKLSDGAPNVIQVIESVQTQITAGIMKDIFPGVGSAQNQQQLAQALRNALRQYRTSNQVIQGKRFRDWIDLKRKVRMISNGYFSRAFMASEFSDWLKKNEIKENASDFMKAQINFIQDEKIPFVALEQGTFESDLLVLLSDELYYELVPELIAGNRNRVLQLFREIMELDLESNRLRDEAAGEQISSLIEHHPGAKDPAVIHFRGIHHEVNANILAGKEKHPQKIVTQGKPNPYIQLFKKEEFAAFLTYIVADIFESDELEVIVGRVKAEFAKQTSDAGRETLQNEFFRSFSKEVDKTPASKSLVSIFVEVLHEKGYLPNELYERAKKNFDQKMSHLDEHLHPGILAPPSSPFQLATRSEVRNNQNVELQESDRQFLELAREIVDPAQIRIRSSNKWAQLHKEFFQYFIDDLRKESDESSPMEEVRHIEMRNLPDVKGKGNMSSAILETFVTKLWELHAGYILSGQKSTRSIGSSPKWRLLTIASDVLRIHASIQAEEELQQGKTISRSEPSSFPDGSLSFTEYFDQFKLWLLSLNRNHDYIDVPAVGPKQLGNQDSPFNLKAILGARQVGFEPTLRTPAEIAFAILEHGLREVSLIPSEPGHGNPPALLLHFVKPVSDALVVKEKMYQSIALALTKTPLPQFPQVDDETSMVEFSDEVMKPFTFKETDPLEEKIEKMERLFDLALSNRFLARVSYTIYSDEGLERLGQILGRTESEQTAIKRNIQIMNERDSDDKGSILFTRFQDGLPEKVLRNEFEKWKNNIRLFSAFYSPETARLKAAGQRAQIIQNKSGLRALAHNKVYRPLVHLLLNVNQDGEWIISEQDAGNFAKELEKLSPFLLAKTGRIQAILDVFLNQEMRKNYQTQFLLQIVKALPMKYRNEKSAHESIEKELPQITARLSVLPVILENSAETKLGETVNQVNPAQGALWNKAERQFIDHLIKQIDSQSSVFTQEEALHFFTHLPKLMSQLDGEQQSRLRAAFKPILENLVMEAVSRLERIQSEEERADVSAFVEKIKPWMKPFPDLSQLLDESERKSLPVIQSAAKLILVKYTNELKTNRLIREFLEAAVANQPYSKLEQLKNHLENARKRTSGILPGLERETLDLISKLSSDSRSEARNTNPLGQIISSQDMLSDEQVIVLEKGVYQLVSNFDPAQDASEWKRTSGKSPADKDYIKSMRRAHVHSIIFQYQSPQAFSPRERERIYDLVDDILDLLDTKTVPQITLSDLSSANVRAFAYAQVDDDGKKDRNGDYYRMRVVFDPLLNPPQKSPAPRSEARSTSSGQDDFDGRRSEQGANAPRRMTEARSKKSDQRELAIWDQDNKEELYRGIKSPLKRRISSWPERYPKILIETQLNSKGRLYLLGKAITQFGLEHAHEKVTAYLEWSTQEVRYVPFWLNIKGRRYNFKIVRSDTNEALIASFYDNSPSHRGLRWSQKYPKIVIKTWVDMTGNVGLFGQSLIHLKDAFAEKEIDIHLEWSQAEKQYVVTWASIEGEKLNFKLVKEDAAQNLIASFYQSPWHRGRLWSQKYPRIMVHTWFDKTGVVSLFGQSNLIKLSKFYAEKPVDVHLKWSDAEKKYVVVAADIEGRRNDFKLVKTDTNPQELIASFYDHSPWHHGSKWSKNYPHLVVETKLDHAGGLSVFGHSLFVHFGNDLAEEKVQVHLEWSLLSKHYVSVWAEIKGKRYDFKIVKTDQDELLDSFYIGSPGHLGKLWAHQYPEIMIQTALDANGTLTLLSKRLGEMGIKNANKKVNAFFEWSSLSQEYIPLWIELNGKRRPFKIIREDSPARHLLGSFYGTASPARRKTLSRKYPRILIENNLDQEAGLSLLGRNLLAHVGGSQNAGKRVENSLEWSSLSRMYVVKKVNVLEEKSTDASSYPFVLIWQNDQLKDSFYGGHLLWSYLFHKIDLKEKDVVWIPLKKTGNTYFESRTQKLYRFETKETDGTVYGVYVWHLGNPVLMGIDVNGKTIREELLKDYTAQMPTVVQEELLHRLIEKAKEKWSDPDFFQIAIITALEMIKENQTDETMIWQAMQAAVKLAVNDRWTQTHLTSLDALKDTIDFQPDESHRPFRSEARNQSNNRAIGAVQKFKDQALTAFLDEHPDLSKSQIEKLWREMNEEPSFTPVELSLQLLIALTLEPLIAEEETWIGQGVLDHMKEISERITYLRNQGIAVQQLEEMKQAFYDQLRKLAEKHDEIGDLWEDVSNFDVNQIHEEALTVLQKWSSEQKGVTKLSKDFTNVQDKLMKITRLQTEVLSVYFYLSNLREKLEAAVKLLEKGDSDSNRSEARNELIKINSGNLQNNENISHAIRESQATTGSRIVKREVERALKALRVGIRKAKLSTAERRIAVNVLVYLWKALAENRIGTFAPMIHGENDYLFAAHQGELIAIAEPILDFHSFLNKGAPEILFREAYQILYENSPLISKLEDLADRILDDKRMWWLGSWESYPHEYLTLQKLIQNAKQYDQEVPNLTWVNIAGFILLTDEKSVQVLNAFLANPAERNQFLFEHRFFNELARTFIYPNTVLQLSAEGQGKSVHFVIQDIRHPEEIQIDFKIGDYYEEKQRALASLPDILHDPDREKAREMATEQVGGFAVAAIPMNAIDETGSASFSMSVPAAGQIQEEPIVKFKGLYGQVVHSGVEILRPNLLPMKNGSTLYVEPSIGSREWLNDPEFGKAYFDFIDKISTVFGGFNVARIGQSFHAVQASENNLYFWGLIDQTSIQRHDHAGWLKALDDRMRIFEFYGISIKNLRNPAFRNLLIEMSQQGFQGFQLEGESQNVKYVFETEELLRAFQKAIEIKKQYEKIEGESLLGFIHQNYPSDIIDFYDPKYNKAGLFPDFEFLPSKLYVELRDKQGQLVHREELATASGHLDKLPMPKSLPEDGFLVKPDNLLRLLDSQNFRSEVRIAGKSTVTFQNTNLFNPSLLNQSAGEREMENKIKRSVLNSATRESLISSNAGDVIRTQVGHHPLLLKKISSDINQQTGMQIIEIEFTLMGTNAQNLTAGNLAITRTKDNAQFRELNSDLPDDIVKNLNYFMNGAFSPQVGVSSEALSRIRENASQSAIGHIENIANPIFTRRAFFDEAGNLALVGKDLASLFGSYFVVITNKAELHVIEAINQQIQNPNQHIEPVWNYEQARMKLRSKGITSMTVIGIEGDEAILKVLTRQYQDLKTTIWNHAIVNSLLSAVENLIVGFQSTLRLAMAA